MWWIVTWICGGFWNGFLFLLSLCTKHGWWILGWILVFVGGPGGGQMLSPLPPALALSTAAGHHAIPTSNRDCLCSPPGAASAKATWKTKKSPDFENPRRFSLCHTPWTIIIFTLLLCLLLLLILIFCEHIYTCMYMCKNRTVYSGSSHIRMWGNRNVFHMPQRRWKTLWKTSWFLVFCLKDVAS